VKALNGIFDGRKNKVREAKSKARLKAAGDKSRHSLRKRILKSGVVRWTCRKCRRCVDTGPEASEFQANISMIVDHGMGGGKSWIAGRKDDKPERRAPSGPVCSETSKERTEMDKSFRKNYLA
jgi:hypothetical protein